MDKTPIQQAIELIESFLSDRAAPNDYEHGKQIAYESARDNLKSLLPKEKEFAGKVFDAGIDFSEGTDQPNKNVFINQLYPEK